MAPTKNKLNQKKNTRVFEIINDEDNQDTQYNKNNKNNDNNDDKSLESDCSESDNGKEDDEINEEILFETLNTFAKNYSKNKSIVDFDYDEIHMMDMEELSDYDINTLLKVLIVRGFKNNNPILWSKTKTLLKLLNFELKPNNFYNYNNRNNKNNQNNKSIKQFKNKDKDKEASIIQDNKKNWKNSKK